MAKGKVALGLIATLVVMASVLAGCTQTKARPLTITTSSLAAGRVGVAYSRTLQASGGSGTYTWTIPYSSQLGGLAIPSGSLPGGLVLDAKTGVISGTPTAPGIFSFTVQVGDSVGHAANHALSITINTAP